MNDFFEVEGIEIRIQQKPIAEFVQQSNEISVDYSVNPRIYLSEDGQLYFYDNRSDEPVPLRNVKQFYSRIRLEEGDLRFYNEELTDFVSLAFFVNASSNVYDKGNSLVENKIKDIQRDSTFESVDRIVDAIKSESFPVKNPQNADVISQVTESFINILLNGRIKDDTVMGFIAKRLTYGCDPDGNNASSFLDISGEDYLYNKQRIAEVMADPKDYAGKLYVELVGDLSKVIQSYDGIGKLLYAIMKNSEFGVEVALNSTAITGNIFYKDANDRLIKIDVSTNNSFRIDAVENAACAYDVSTAVRVNTKKNSNVAFKHTFGEITALSGSGLYNSPITVPEGCNIDEPDTISLVDTTEGDISFEESTVLFTEENQIFAWFKSPDITDNLGDARFDYVNTEIGKTLKGNFRIRARVECDWVTEHPVFETITTIPDPGDQVSVNVTSNGTVSSIAPTVPTGLGATISALTDGNADTNYVVWDSTEIPFSFKHEFTTTQYVTEYRFYASPTNYPIAWTIYVTVAGQETLIDEKIDQDLSTGGWHYYPLNINVRCDSIRIEIQGASDITVGMSEIEFWGFAASDPIEINTETITVEFPKIVNSSGVEIYDPETNTFSQQGIIDPLFAPSIFSRRRMIGVFEAGKIEFEILNGNVKPNQRETYPFNSPVTVGYSAHEDTLRYAFVNSTFGEISFSEITEFEITETTVVEVWYEDFDSTDNEGVLDIRYEYTPAVFSDVTADNINDYSLLPEYSCTNYVFDHLVRIFSTQVKAYWFDAVLDLLQDANEVSFNKLAKDVDFFDGRLLSSVNDVLSSDEKITEMSTTIPDTIREQIFSDKVFYDEPVLTGLSTGVIDYRNYFVYRSGANSEILYEDFTSVNDIWLDMPDFYGVVPKSPKSYAASILSNFTVDYRMGIASNIEFRLYDSTSDTELDRVMFKFPENYSHTKHIGDVIFENSETLHVQLSYFGPLSTISCKKDIIETKIQNNEAVSNNVNSHIVLRNDEVFTEDLVDRVTYGTIIDRVEQDLKEEKEVGVSGVVELEAPRVIRVQWRQSFYSSPDPILKDSIGNFTMDQFAPASDSKMSINVYAFSSVNVSGKTVQGVLPITIGRKRFTIRDTKLSTFGSDDYSVTLSANKNVNVWYENKTSTTFDIVLEREFDGEVSWTAIKGAGTDTEFVRDENKNLLPDCIIDNKPKYSDISDYDILINEGYVFAEQTDEIDAAQPIIAENTDLIDSDVSTFVDPNGPRCSQECFDDCPEDYICSPECFTASLTDSGCGCCQCLDDNECGDGYFCNDVNECQEI